MHYALPITFYASNGQSFNAVFERFPVRIGRNQLNDLHIDRPYISQFHAHIEHGVVADAEFGRLALRLDLRLGEMAALGAGDILDLGVRDAELQRRIAVLVGGPHGDNLTVVHLEDRDRDVLAGRVEDPRHSQLLSYQSSAHHAFTPRA